MKKNAIFIISLKRILEKLFTVQAILSVEKPADARFISSRDTGQLAMLKFVLATGSTLIAGVFTPGTHTHQIQAALSEPLPLVVTAPKADHQSITETSYVNPPTIVL